MDVYKGSHVLGEFRLLKDEKTGYINIPKNYSCSLKAFHDNDERFEPISDIDYIVYLREPISRFYSACCTYGKRSHSSFERFFECITSDIENNKDIFYDEHMSPQYVYIEPFLQYPIEYIILENMNLDMKNHNNQTPVEDMQLVKDNLSMHEDRIREIYKKDIDLYDKHKKLSQINYEI